MSKLNIMNQIKLKQPKNANFQTQNQFYQWIKTINVFELNRWIKLNQSELKKMNFLTWNQFYQQINEWITIN